MAIPIGADGPLRSNQAEVGRGAGTVANRAISYGESIAHDIERVEQRLAELKRVHEILTQHPEFEELLTLVGRVGRY